MKFRLTTKSSEFLRGSRKKKFKTYPNDEIDLT